MKRILDALAREIEKELLIPVVFAPQRAGGNSAAITIYFTGLVAGGERAGNASAAATERLSFSANFSISGTHEKWLTNAVLFSRRLTRFLEEEHGFLSLMIPAEEKKEVKARAVCYRSGQGEFVYDEENKSMPVSYVERFLISLDYPAALIEEE